MSEKKVVLKELMDEARGPVAAALQVIGEDPSALDVQGFELAEGTPSWVIAAAATAEESGVDEAIDGWLGDLSRSAASRAHVLDALLRAGVCWDHPALLGFLSEEEAGFLASYHLAVADLEGLLEHLGALEDERALLAGLRAAGLAGEEELFEELFAWRQELEEELEPGDLEGLDGLLAAWDPRGYARALLAGDADRQWLGNDRAVADALTLLGTNHWVETLALTRQIRDREAFELAAAFAVAASLTELFDDVEEDRLDPDHAAQWPEKDPARVAFHLAIGEEEELSELLVATTLHQCLLERGLVPPPVAGLPLSSGVEDQDQGQLREGVEELIKGEGVQGRVAAYRTLTDLRRSLRREEIGGEDAEVLLGLFADHKEAQVREVAATLLELSTKGPEGFEDWGCRGLAALHDVLTAPGEGSAEVLARALWTVPPERSPLVRGALEALQD